MRRGELTGQAIRQRGFGLVFLLLAVAVLGATAMIVATDWAQQIQREKEDELLRVGDQYAQAIAAYYFGSPNPVRRYPNDLSALLEDRRVPFLRRHLRTLYADPLTGSQDWGLVPAPDGGIMGVYSRSAKAPWQRMSMTLNHTNLPSAQQYSDWKFIARTP